MNVLGVQKVNIFFLYRKLKNINQKRKWKKKKKTNKQHQTSFAHKQQQTSGPFKKENKKNGAC
jgi:hypothetical protein